LHTVCISGEVTALGRYVSDSLVDLLGQLGCRYLPLNPGSSFRGLHDSIVNHAGNDKPEVILCTHEEIAVSIAHAYAKATGQVGFAAVHDLVGLMHASMAVYDAWCDRTPLVVLGGGGPADPSKRRPIDWFHSANTQSDLVRPFVKWDSDPAYPQETIDAVARAHFIAGSAPTGPTYVTIDAAVQEQVDEGTVVPVADRAHRAPFVAHENEIDESAAQLVAAAFPVVVAGGVGLDANSTSLLISLMETLGAAGRDERNLTALPTDHQLCFSGDDAVLEDADLILAIDVHDVRWILDRSKSALRVIDLSTRSLAVRSWANADHVTGHNVTSLVSDPLAGLAALQRSVEEKLSSDSEFLERRNQRLAALANRRQRLEQTRADRLAERWDETPIAPERMVAELYRAVENLPWLLTLRNTRSWPEGIWKFDRAGRFLGHSGGGGMGYGSGAMVGGSLAARDRGEFAVGIIGDGDLMFAPGAIWTAVHHEVPMLVVVNNNRTYLNDEHHQAQVARQRGRPVENAHIGTTIDQPDIDFAELAMSLGAWAEGPVTDPDSLPGVFERGVKEVQRGGVALVDVITGR
jgi:acetolactate synthase-1/2/3 large subunit